MYLAIILMPLLGSIISGFFGRKIGVKGSHFVTCLLVISTTLLAILSFLETGLTNLPVSVNLLKWVDSESINLYWAFNFDSVTVSMLIPVLIVSSLVHFYSIGYMSHDPHNQRFFSYLSLFTFMMIILVTANNYLLMFVGWEGVGICSYLLVSFWFTRIAANQSSIAAILTNRVGDCLLTVGMFIIVWSLGNLDYSTIFTLSPYINENGVTVIGICLLIGAMAKSSQIGLHVWLPMAMEGPTPVSALIHAATMVTAGVYLLIRSSPLIEYSSTVLLLCLWIGAITTVFSSLIGLFQQDIKKVIAYSTMSQLGLMVVAIGLSSYNIALFHLVNHAFYKALLFLGAGAVIHAIADNQDFRRYGGLKQFLPLSYSVMFIASLSLVAFPFMTGFYSKDFILESAFGQYSLSSIIVYYIATIGAMFTTLYSVKTLYLTFIANPNGSLTDYKNIHEGNLYISLPLVVLAVFSIYLGFITKDMFIGLGSSLFIDNGVYIYPTNEIMINTEFAVPTLYKLLPLVFTISLTLISVIISEYLYKSLIAFKFSNIGYNIFSFFNLRFLVELIYNKYITENVLKLGGQTTKVLDKGAIELIGPSGLEKGLQSVSKMISLLSTGIVTSYALYILVAGLVYVLSSYLSLLSNCIVMILLVLLGTIISYRSRITYNNTNILNSSLINIYLIYNWVKLIRNSYNDYIANFNLSGLILSYISYRLMFARYIFLVILPIDIYYYYSTGIHLLSFALLWKISSCIIIAILVYNLLHLPLNSKSVITWITKFGFNYLIIVAIMLTGIILYNVWCNTTWLSLSKFILLSDYIIFMNSDGPSGPSDPFGGPNPSGGPDPSGGPSGGPGPNELGPPVALPDDDEQSGRRWHPIESQGPFPGGQDGPAPGAYTGPSPDDDDNTLDDLYHGRRVLAVMRDGGGEVTSHPISEEELWEDRMRRINPDFQEGPRSPQGISIYSRVVVSHETEGDIRDVYPEEDNPPRNDYCPVQ